MTITKVNIIELLTKAENQYAIVKRLHQMFNESLDFEFEDSYLSQLAVYAGLMQQVKMTAPQLFAVKLDEVLEDIAKLKTEMDNQVLTPEMVSHATLLFDTATALGWIEPQPEVPVYTCEVCGFKGRLGLDIVERPYFNSFYRHDSTRWECRDFEACLTRIGR